MSKWRPVTSDIPQGLLLGPALFNIYVSNMDSRIKRILSKFADHTKLCGAVDTLEGRDTIQRDLNRLERWAHVNLMKFNKANCRVLHTGWGNPKHKYRLGREWVQSSPEEKDLGVLAEEKLNMTQRCALCSPEGQPYPGLNQKQHGQQVEGGDSAPLLRSGETPPGVLRPALEPSAQKRHGFKVKEGRFRLDVRNNFFSMRVVKHWHKMPREAVDAPSLEVFQARLDGALSNLV